MTVTVTWLGHATVRLELAGAVLLTDPVLGARVGPLQRVGPPPRPTTYAGVDAVLLSHLHLDHADVPSLRRLGRTPVLTGPANAGWAGRHTDGVVTSPVDWQRIPGTAVEVRLVRADHHHRRMPHRPNDAHGFLVRSADAVVWFAGDTSLHVEMGGLPSVAGRPVDLAVVSVGGWGPRLGAGHMGPAEAVEAVRRCDAHAALAVHTGSLRPPLLGWGDRPAAWMTRPLEEFGRLLPARLHGVRHLDLRPGEKAAVRT